MVRQAQAQRAHAEPREQPRKPDVPRRVGVPLRQHEHGPPAPPAPADVRAGKYRACTTLFSGCGVTSALGNVRRAGSVPSAGRRSYAVRRRGRVERIRVAEHLRRRSAPAARAGRSAGSMAIRGNPVVTPLERANAAVGRGRRETPLPVVKQRSQHVNGGAIPVSHGARRGRRASARRWASMLQIDSA